VKDQHVRVRDAAVEALAGIGTPPGEPLLAALRNCDYRVVAGAYLFFIKRGEPDSEGALIAVLDKFGSFEMAKYFLNCGNSKLEKAAGAWGGRHGYSVERIRVPAPAALPQGWGSSNPESRNPGRIRNHR